MRGGLRRARRHLQGPLAFAFLLGVSACGRPADAVPAPVSRAAVSASAVEPTARPADGSSPARAPGASPAPAAAAGEVACAAAPLAVRVGSLRRESGDSVRLELTLANLAAPDTWSPESAEGTAMRAAVEGLAGASMLSADGRRRVFALRDAAGDRVGSPLTAPVPGRPQTVWTRFPAADGRVSLLLPGCPPVAGLTVAARPASPEP